MRRLAALAVASGMTWLGLVGVSGDAQAVVPGPNGRIAFAREIPSLDGFATFTIDSDGTDEARLLGGASEAPRWSPDGSEIAVSSCQNPPDCTTAATIVDPDTGDVVRWFEFPDPDIFTVCVVWSPDGGRLACEGFGEPDPALTGIYTIDATDGTDLTRITSNPGGDDQPGDYSPNGNRIVFLRTDPDRPERRSQALFIAKVDGSVGPHRVTPWGLSQETGRWSPDGETIRSPAPGTSTPCPLTAGGSSGSNSRGGARRSIPPGRRTAGGWRSRSTAVRHRSLTSGPPRPMGEECCGSQRRGSGSTSRIGDRTPMQAAPHEYTFIRQHPPGPVADLRAISVRDRRRKCSPT